MTNINNIAVLYGGFSNEREVSLNTGKNCATALQTLGYDVTLVDVTTDIQKLVNTLVDIKPDVVFNALHGLYGEDGCVQGLLEMMQIPYTHSGIEASAIAMDKEKSKLLFKAAGIPVADAKCGNILELKNTDIKKKMVLKPVKEGSSIGVYIIESSDEIDANAWRYGRAMLEEYIEGREITVGVMGDKVIGMLEITTNSKFYNYSAKYDKGGSEHIRVENICKDVVGKLEQYALLAHKTIGARGVTRCDFIVDEKTNDVYLLEINTQPGMTSVSLIPDIAKNNKISYEDIVKYMVENATCDMC